MAVKLNDFIDDQDFSKKIEKVDFDGIAFVIRLEYQWTTLRIEQGINRYKQLLFLLHRYPDQSIVPDQETDLVVHTHLATGDRYIKDCQTLFNAYLAHEHGFGLQQDSEQLARLQNFDRVQRLIKQWFNNSFSHSSQPAFCILRLIPEPLMSFSG